MPFETEQTKLDSGILILALSGTMTMGSQLQKFEWTVDDLAKTGPSKIVLDMSKVTYLDSSGIGVLLNCSAQVKNSGGQLRLAALTDRVFTTLKLVGLESFLPISTTKDEAVSALA